MFKHLKSRASISRSRCPKGFTLVELLVTAVISAILILGILAVFQFNFTYWYQQELRASAMDAMHYELEQLNRKFIFRVEPQTILVHDNRTPDNTSDDTHGRLSIRLFDRDGNELTHAPASRDRVRVVMTVQWRGRGRQSTKMFSEELVASLMP